MAYGEIEIEDYTDAEKAIAKYTNDCLIIFELFKFQRQLTVDEWYRRKKPTIITRDKKRTVQIGNLKHTYTVYQDFAYGNVVVVANKEKLDVQISRGTVFIYGPNGKLKGLIASGYEDEKITCFEVV